MWRSRKKPNSCMPMYKLIAVTTAAVSLSAIAGLGIAIAHNSGLMGTSTPKTTTGSITLGEIQKLSQLATAKQISVVPVKAESSSNVLGINIATTKILLFAKVSITAGVDLGQLQADAIQQTESGIVLTLPSARILTTSLDPAVEIYDYDRGALGLGPDNAPILQVEAQKKAVDDAVVAACKSGIIEQANQQAVTALSGVLAIGHPDQQIQVQVQPANECGAANAN